MIVFFFLFLLTLSKENPIKFAYLWIDRSYSQSKENDEHYTKLCKDMFKKACNSFSGNEKHQCDLLYNSFLGVFVSDLRNSKQKIYEIQKSAKILYINGRPFKITNNKHKSQMAARLDADDSLSLSNRIQKTVNKTVSDMIKRKFNGRKMSFRDLQQSNRHIKKTVKQKKNENMFEIKRKRNTIEDGITPTLIIGIVFSCLVFTAIIIVLICICCKNMKNKKVNNQNSDQQQNDPNQQQNNPNQQPYPPQQYPNQQYPQQPYPNQQYPPQQSYPNQQYPPQQNFPNQQYPQQPYPNQQYPPQQYPNQQPYPNQPYPPQNYSNPYQNPSGYPNQAYQSQPYAGSAIPVQPYDNNNQFNDRDIAYRDGDNSKISDVLDSSS